MPVIAAVPEYRGEMLDRQEKFNGKQLLYIGWEDHLMYCAPLCIPVDPQTPFGALPKEIIPKLYEEHPDTALIDWSKVEWFRSGQPFTPDLDASVLDNGLGHKAIVRFRTPGLTGLQGSCS
ncbi:MAG: phenol hydroxylase subunit P4 [Sinimarinibacterium flocculans]|uniref:phenol hydroxylase subunit P4 n=1 Tax=Sinimarinibacterium flocculans TaxID=985250 RepID=UPI003C42F8E5